MRKTNMLAAVLAVSFSAFLLAAAQPAFADGGYVGDAVEHLANSPVYVDGSVELSNEAAITNELSGANVNVVVFPETALGNFAASDLANDIYNKTGVTTIVVIDKGGTDTIAVSSAENGSDISVLLHKNLSSSNGEAGNVILANVKEVQSLSSAPVSAPDNVSEGGFDGGFIAPLFIFATLVALAVFIGKRVLHNHLMNNQTAPVNQFSKLVPASMVPYLKQFNELAQKHATLGNKSQRASIEAISMNVQELFNRISKKGTVDQKRQVELEYAEKLPKLIEALGTNYYIDIVEHDDLWDNPDERLVAVRVAVQAVEKQLVQNIRQVNASKDLEFQFALDSLAGSASASITDINELLEIETKQGKK